MKMKFYLPFILQNGLISVSLTSVSLNSNVVLVICRILDGNGFYTEGTDMKLKKQMFLPVLLSLSVFFASTVTMSASAYAAAVPRTAAVWELAEAAPNNTEIPEVKKDKGNTPGRSGNAKSRDDSSFFDNLLEKIAVMFLVYMFLEAINALLNDFFHDGDTKIKIVPKEKQDQPDGKGTKQNKNIKRIPAQDV
jgi:hypothetical protein